MDYKDCIRRSSSLTYLSSDETLLQSIKENVCFGKSEKCSVQAKVAIFCHSMYDMTTETVADMLQKHGVEVAFGFITYNSEMLINKQGVLSTLNMTYIKNEDTNTLHMNFREDPSEGYCHNLSNYLELMASTYYVSNGGAVYKMETIKNVCGNHYYKLSLVIGQKTDAV